MAAAPCSRCRKALPGDNPNHFALIFGPKSRELFWCLDRRADKYPTEHVTERGLCSDCVDETMEAQGLAFHEAAVAQAELRFVGRTSGQVFLECEGAEAAAVGDAVQELTSAAHLAASRVILVTGIDFARGADREVLTLVNREPLL